MSWLIAIDPGLDAAGVATFNLDLYDNRSDVESLAATLASADTIRTDPDWPLENRLAKLGEGVRSQMNLPGHVRYVFVEQPAFAGTYKRNRAAVGRDGMAENMSKLYMALGALVAAASSAGTRPTIVPAPRIPKDQRHVLAKAIFEASPVRKILDRRLPSQDALDAIWLGAQQMIGDVALERRRAGFGVVR